MVAETIEQITVKLDIAGFYYDIEVKIDPTGATVKTVLDAALGVNNARGATLISYSEDVYSESNGAERTIDSFKIKHTGGSAKSRQSGANAAVPARQYADGLYELADNGTFNAAGRLVSLDPTVNFVLAWQYYVYTPLFKDESRAAGSGVGSIPREIVGYSESGSRKAYTLVNGSTVVWRMVVIMTGPTHPHVESSTSTYAA